MKTTVGGLTETLLATPAIIIAEHVRHRKPQIDLYVAAYPLRERALETVPHRYGEGYRTEYRQHHEEEGADGVYHEGGGLEQQFQYLAEEVA